MTTTSVFQGIQEGSKLSSRVLKPPGGGSSISFSDDDDAKCVSRSSPEPSSPSPSSSAQVPSLDSTTPSTVATPSSHKESNGMVHDTKVVVEPDTSTSNTESTQQSSIVINGKSIEVANCDSKPVQSESDKAGADIPVPSLNSDVEENVNPKNAVVKSPESKIDAHVVNGNCVDDKKESVDRSVISNGIMKSPHVPTEAVYQASSPLFALSPASPSMKPNEDTQDRVIGHSNGNSTPISAMPRKIKDHMRSSIVMSDEDYTPTRSSRTNATINDTTPEHQPAAGQRQRIPPGGFSSKLW